MTLQDAQRETAILARRLGLAARENEELAQSACSEPNLAGKVVYDLEDPSRPRFTLAELKDILQERNSLKVCQQTWTFRLFIYFTFKRLFYCPSLKKEAKQN